MGLLSFSSKIVIVKLQLLSRGGFPPSLAMIVSFKYKKLINNLYLKYFLNFYARYLSQESNNSNSNTI